MHPTRLLPRVVPLWYDAGVRRFSLFCAVLVVVAPGAGCPVDPPDRLPAQLSLQLATKSSCGRFSALDYDTSCMGAISLQVRDEGRVPLVDDCTSFADLERRPVDLGALLRGPQVLGIGAPLSTNRKVLFEVRGLHDRGLAEGEPVSALCDRATDPNEWLFWGESAVVDLAAFDDVGGTVVVPIVIDCRDCGFECAQGDCFGCQGLGVGTCPVELPLSFCVPAVDFTCDKACEDDGDCFEGARRCDEDSGRCDKVEATGGLCAPCALEAGVPVGCGEGFQCVGRPGATSGFCAESCPDNVCVAGTRCNRIGNNLELVQ